MLKCISNNESFTKLLACVAPILCYNFFAASPITVNIGIIIEHSVQMENITLVLFSTMYCSGLFCSGEKRRKKKKKKSHPGLSFLLVDPVFLFGSCALADCPNDRTARRRWKTTVAFKFHKCLCIECNDILASSNSGCMHTFLVLLHIVMDVNLILWTEWTVLF